MGFRFEVRHANVMANLLSGRLSSSIDQEIQWEDIRAFSEAAGRNFVSSDERYERQFVGLLEELGRWLRRPNARLAAKELADRASTSLGAPQWLGMLIADREAAPEVSDAITDYQFLREVIRSPRQPSTNYVLLQPVNPSDGVIALENAFPAFSAALQNRAKWPCVLVWTRNSGFGRLFPLPISSGKDAFEAVQWVVNNASRLHVDKHQTPMKMRDEWRRLLRQYLHAFPEAAKRSRHISSVLHLSDLHCGSSEALARSAGLRQIIRHVKRYNTFGSPMVPVVTGDLMDTPHDAAMGHAEMLLEDVESECGRKPIVIPGNHDLRIKGWMYDDHRYGALFANGGIVDDLGEGLSFICFNSCQAKAHWARGNVGERQLRVLGQQLDANGRSGQLRIALIHHHLVPVSIPTWYKKPLLEKILGVLTFFQPSMELKDAGVVTNWLRQRDVGLVLHGHMHIPQVSQNAGLSIVGCGSSVGKVQTAVTGEVYVSVNLLTINKSTRRAYCDLIAERIPGTVPFVQERHEVSTVFRI